mmetsp:Transcript_89016/g.160547  ORF Transcript_89016/g.160547 Transcript_89016/m.160547 type:complete len:202 (+) Transcript_89016:91-696(+)
MNDGLHRASTQKIADDTKKGGMMILGLGLCTSMSVLVSSFIYIWYSTTIPDDCVLRTYFFGMGIINVIMAILLACLTFFGKGLAVSSGHSLLHDKYKAEGRDAEAQQQEEELGQEVSMYGSGLACVACFLVPLSLFALGWCIYGIVKAVEAARGGAADCEQAVTVFWIMLAVNLLQQCASKCKQSQTSQIQQSATAGSDSD